jgi:hypothetical protein
LKIAERRVRPLDGFDRKRVGVERRRLERANRARVVTSERVIDQN